MVDIVAGLLPGLATEVSKNTNHACDFKEATFSERRVSFCTPDPSLSSDLTIDILFYNFSFCFQHQVDFLYLMLNSQNNSKDKEFHKGNQGLPGLWTSKLSGSDHMTQKMCGKVCLAEAFLC